MRISKLKDDTMNESDLQRVHKIALYPRDSKVYSNKEFITFDNGKQRGAH